MYHKLIISNFITYFLMNAEFCMEIWKIQLYYILAADTDRLSSMYLCLEGSTSLKLCKFA